MDFTTRNIAVAKLLKADVPEDLETVQVPNKTMSPLMKREAAILYSAIFGAKFEMDDFSLTLKAKNGEVQRVYGPSAGAVLDADENVVSAIGIKWGEKFATIPLDKSSLKTPALVEGLLEKGTKFAKFEIDEANFGFKDNEISVNVAVETDDDYFTIAFPLRFQDPKNAPDLATFKTGLKKDASKFLQLLYPVFEGRGGGGGGSSIRKLTELGENEVVTIVEVVDYNFTTKKGEDRESKLLVSDAGDKFWSADITAPAIKYLLQDVKGVKLSILEKAKGKKNEYIQLGYLETLDGELNIPFGASIKTTPERELPEGLYQVLDVDSFNCTKDGKTFKSYVYTVFDEDHEIYKTFVPSKHRTILSAAPDISVEKPGTFTVLSSGKEGGEFLVTQLKCDDVASDFDFDVSQLF